MNFFYLISIFIIATCGLIYELIAGSLASYLLGDSITQFSTVIGVYLFSMGVGSYLSKYITKNLLSTFVQVEYLIGLVGGFSSVILFISFNYVESFRVILYSLVTLTGIFVGVEIPLIMRIMQERYEFKDLVAKVFTFDYVGALLASLLFPLVLVPQLGLVKSSLLFGIINVSVGLFTVYLLFDKSYRSILLQISGFISLLLLLGGFVYADHILDYAEKASLGENVVYTKSSKYQRIAITSSKNELKLFLNGNLQFSTRDEYRYHEALVHMGLASLKAPKKILVLGGGDGLAVREILKYEMIEQVILVDLDPEMTRLFRENELLTELNQNALNNKKVKVINDDAFIWMKKNKEKFDFIVVDFPDPSNFSIGKLYTNTFFNLLGNALAPSGLGVLQSTSPYVAKKAYWCINNTLKSVGLSTFPYHAYVPAFGDWGYFLFSKGAFTLPTQFPENLKFMNSSVASSLSVFPEDTIVNVTDVNKLNNQILVRYFEEEWARYVQ